MVGTSKVPVGLDVLACRPTSGSNRRKRRSNSSPPRVMTRKYVQSNCPSISNFNEVTVPFAPAYDVLKKLESSIIYQESDDDNGQMAEQISSFFLQPPSEPVRVIILGKVPENYTNISSQHYLPSTTKTDEELLGIISPDPYPYFYSPSSRISMSTTYQKLKLKNTPMTDKKKRKASIRVVHSLLKQLFADLNLKSGSNVIPKINREKRNCSPINDDEIGQEEWIGGVRALRDCCVRLVLRQLRHINRLNRAIDRSLFRPRSACKSTNTKRLSVTTLSRSLRL